MSGKAKFRPHSVFSTLCLQSKLARDRVTRLAKANTAISNFIQMEARKKEKERKSKGTLRFGDLAALLTKGTTQRGEDRREKLEAPGWTLQKGERVEAGGRWGYLARLVMQSHLVPSFSISKQLSSWFRRDEGQLQTGDAGPAVGRGKRASCVCLFSVVCKLTMSLMPKWQTLSPHSQYEYVRNVVSNKQANKPKTSLLN